ncbi:MAG TPA: hypothetical protein VKY73_15720 [Polyangiaceae bacterium]|nr:hypothetical protein [Polyangiaceae bacterium]
MTPRELEDAPPASLVAEANRALADETAHAEICFGRASAYAGERLGPGPLDMSGALESTSLAELVHRTFVEGLHRTDVGRARSRPHANTATDPAVASAFAQLAEDEVRHAALAYRFVAHCLEHAGARRGALVARLKRALAAAAAEHGHAPQLALTEPSSSLVAHGYLPVPLRQALAAEAFREIVMPCTNALLATAERCPASRANDDSRGRAWLGFELTREGAPSPTRKPETEAWARGSARSATRRDRGCDSRPRPRVVPGRAVPRRVVKG